MITASSIPRLRACPSSAALPRAENHSVWADAGNDEHEELAIDAGEFASLVPAGARSEVKLAYDVATRSARILGEGAGRDYGAPGPFEIVGTSDVMGAEAGRAVIVDWKTGYADVEPAATNGQLWFYALAACRALGLSSAVIRIVYTKTGRVDEYEIGPLELAEFAGELEALHRRVADRQAARARGEALDTREGGWCKHCPSKHACPSKRALLVQFATGGLATIGDAAMTAERAPQAYRQIVALEQLVKDARARLVAYVDETGPIDLGNGTMFGRYSKQGKESLDGAVTVRAIREVLGEQAAKFEAIAIEQSTSKAALKRAADAVMVGRGTTKVVTAIVAKVRELGGASRGASSRPIGEYPAGRDDAAVLDTASVDAALAEAV